MKGIINLFGVSRKEIELPDDFLETLPVRLGAFIKEAEAIHPEIEVRMSEVVYKPCLQCIFPEEEQPNDQEA